MSEQNRSNARRLQVLRAVVEDYVHSREPVGSKALVERHGLGVSAATVRNDMAALEEDGLIVAPHTSAGRIPTEKGYRFFVDRIQEVKPLSAAERRAIHTLLDGADSIDDVLAKTVRALAQVTRQVAVIQVPRPDGARVRHVEIVDLGPGQALVILITTTGVVQQRVVSLPEGMSEDDIAMIRRSLLSLVSGLDLREAAGLAVTVEALVPPSLRSAAGEIARVVTDLATAGVRDRMVMAGAANLARSQQDFEGNITPLLEALEEQVLLLKLLAEMEQDSSGVAVRIGSENAGTGLNGASVVASGYGPGNNSMIGVLGPTRMDYPGSIGAVRAIARYLSRILSA
ncbi:MAG: heat-inducible transcriptional repressor HrcA [Galactobacter sp.]|uniref:heat-inducible transcriptional repressor HrcA n=1 Tax=Galactobacter sp. TaxID=2676125 RepID=UPI0025B95D39|nr:heat-inducible transcriptional repressor HrcA [Galactobacter sp.]